MAPPKPRPRSTAVHAYMMLYNAASAVAWAVVLGRTVALYSLHGPQSVHMGVGEWTKWTQTAAVLEVLHSLFHIVSAPIITTTMQVLSRLILVWGIVHNLPFLAGSPAYTTMLLAWSVTEVIRYGYFTFATAGHVPRPLVWLRYSSFLPLYPVGITSECVVILKAVPYMPQVIRGGDVLLYAVLVAYVPSTYILYTHMLRQRRKILRNPAAVEEKKSK